MTQAEELRWAKELERLALACQLLATMPSPATALAQDVLLLRVSQLAARWPYHITP